VTFWQEITLKDQQIEQCIIYISLVFWRNFDSQLTLMCLKIFCLYEIYVAWLLLKCNISYCFCVITSAEKGGYVFGSVCLSVCLFVCLFVCLSVRRITRKLVNGF